MKKIALFSIIALISLPVIAQNDKVVRLSDPVVETETYEVFGEEVEEWGQTQTLASLISSQDTYSGQEIMLETEVAEVCQKKGCFFIAQQEDQTARITFKDYEFFIPTDAQGKKVTLKGIFSVKELTEKQAKHYAEDAGTNPDSVKGPQREYSIVATSVKIPK